MKLAVALLLTSPTLFDSAHLLFSQTTSDSTTGSDKQIFSTTNYKYFFTQNIKHMFIETVLLSTQNMFVFVCFNALRPKSTALVMAGLSHFFLGKLEHAVNQ